MTWRTASGPAGEVGAITVLQNQPDSDKALRMLKELHGIVKPVMKKHGWYLPELKEFFPGERNLLGVNYNMGQKICIRLRPAHDRYSFLDLEDSLIETMLHELTHNKRGPHDDLFFKIMSSLQEELDFQRKKGYLTFSGGGQRVGTAGGAGKNSNLSLRQGREQALRKIEEREKMRRLLGGGGKLGGSAQESGKRRSEVLADAAERRLRATRGCGGDDGHSHYSGGRKEDLPASVQAAIDDAEQNSRRVVIDLTHLDTSEDEDGGVSPKASTSGSGKVKTEGGDAGPSTSTSTSKGEKRSRSSTLSSDDDDDIVIISSKPAVPLPQKSPSRASRGSSFLASRPSSGNPSRPSSRLLPPSSTSTSSSRPPTRTASPLTAWTCPTCTFLNRSASFTQCEVCLDFRPGSVSAGGGGKGKEKVVDDGWCCEGCSTTNDHQFWTCKVCGEVKKSSERG